MYRIDVFDSSGNKLSELTEFEKLSCAVQCNTPGILSFSATGLQGDKLPNILCPIELWRNDPTYGIGWYRQFSGWVVKWDRSLNGSTTYHDFTALGDEWLLSWRINNYYANYTDRTVFSAKKAEYIAKTLVKYNITSNATTANGRKRDGTNFPANVISVQTDAGTGNTLDFYCFGDNLLDSLQKLADIGGGDFALYKTGNYIWEFRWYNGQLGSNKTNSVILSYELGTLDNPEYKVDLSGEATVAAIWGNGEESNRTYTTYLAGEYSVSYDREVFVNASGVDTTNGMVARAQTVLARNCTNRELSFDIVQMPSCRYKLHYDLGDLVSLKNPFTGTVGTVKINKVVLEVDESGKEDIAVEVR